MNIVIDQLAAFYIVLALLAVGVALLYFADRRGSRQR